MKLKVFFWAISCTWLLYLTANLVLEKGAKTGNEPSFLQMFRETHKKGTEFATREIAQKYVRIVNWSSATFFGKYKLLMFFVFIFFKDEIRDVMEKDPSLSQMEVGVLMSFCIFVVVSLREVRLFLKDLLYCWIIWIMFMCCQLWVWISSASLF